MATPRIRQDALRALPAHVRSKLVPTDLEEHFKDLVRVLYDGTAADWAASTSVKQVVHHLLNTLRSTTAPISRATLEGIASSLHGLTVSVSQQDDGSTDREIAEIMAHCAALPQLIHEEVIDDAQQLRASVVDARRHLRSANTLVSSQIETVKQSADEALDAELGRLRRKSEELNGQADETLAEVEAAKTSTTEEMERLLDQVREKYGFTGAQVLGGAHENKARESLAEAKKHRWWGLGSLLAAVAYALMAQVFSWTPDWQQWTDVLGALPIASPILILLVIARNENRLASRERQLAGDLMHLSLQFQALEPYRSLLDDETRPVMDKQIMSRMFPGDTSSGIGPDPSADA